MKKLAAFAIKHFSFGLIILGAGCFFLANILFKNLLNDVQYGQYSVIITYLSVVYILGLLGLEQVFLRYSTPTAANVISTQKFQIRLIGTAVMITPVLAVLFFKYYFTQVRLDYTLLYFSSVSMVALLLIFNVFRLNANFIFAQFIANFWRIFLVLLALFAFYICRLDFIFLINSILVSVIVVVVLAFIFCLKRIRFVFDDQVGKKELFFTAIQFLISIITFSLLTFGDRFIVESKFSIEEFGNYFYLTNFFLAPFTILQNYVGFRQLVFFKTDFNILVFNSFNRKFLLLGSILGLILLGTSYALRFVDALNFKFEDYTVVIILLILLGIVRLYSASINSAFEAKTNIKSLQRANIIFVLFSIVIIAITTFFSSLEMIIMAIVLIWFIRCMIMKKILLSQLSEV